MTICPRIIFTLRKCLIKLHRPHWTLRDTSKWNIYWIKLQVSLYDRISLKNIDKLSFIIILMFQSCHSLKTSFHDLLIKFIIIMFQMHHSIKTHSPFPADIISWSKVLFFSLPCSECVTLWRYHFHCLQALFYDLRIKF